MPPAIYRCLSAWQPRFVCLSHKLFLLFAWKPGRFHFFHGWCFPFSAAITTDAAYYSYLSKGTLYYLRACLHVPLLVVLKAITSNMFWENHSYYIIVPLLVLKLSVVVLEGGRAGFEQPQLPGANWSLFNMSCKGRENNKVCITTVSGVVHTCTTVCYLILIPYNNYKLIEEQRVKTEKPRAYLWGKKLGTNPITCVLFIHHLLFTIIPYS